MADGAGDFRPNDPLSRGVLENLVAGLTESTPVTPANPAAKVTMAGLDARLVNALGLADAAKLFGDGARAAGLVVPTRFGNEATARLLGLRTNHPASQDELELLPTSTATRAEAAFSAAKILRFTGWEAEAARQTAATFALPPLSIWQKRILMTAFRFIGYPYVWGGTSEHAEAPFGHQAPGGFDCSGFVWRVYKYEAYPGAGRLADTLKGRTTYAMSGEVPAAKRIPYAKLQPGDVVFFGRGPASKPAQIGHMGIYVGNGWLVHSSGYGVAVAQMSSGWYPGLVRLGPAAPSRGRTFWFLACKRPVNAPNPPNGGFTGTAKTGESPGLAFSVEVVHVAMEAPVDRPRGRSCARCGSARSVHVGRSRPADLVLRSSP